MQFLHDLLERLAVVEGWLRTSEEMAEQPCHRRRCLTGSFRSLAQQVGVRGDPGGMLGGELGAVVC